MICDKYKYICGLGRTTFGRSSMEAINDTTGSHNILEEAEPNLLFKHAPGYTTTENLQYSPERRDAGARVPYGPTVATCRCDGLTFMLLSIFLHRMLLSFYGNVPHPDTVKLGLAASKLPVSKLTIESERVRSLNFHYTTKATRNGKHVFKMQDHWRSYAWAQGVSAL